MRARARGGGEGVRQANERYGFFEIISTQPRKPSEKAKFARRAYLIRPHIVLLSRYYTEGEVQPPQDSAAWIVVYSSAHRRFARALGHAQGGQESLQRASGVERCLLHVLLYKIVRRIVSRDPSPFGHQIQTSTPLSPCRARELLYHIPAGSRMIPSGIRSTSYAPTTKPPPACFAVLGSYGMYRTATSSTGRFVVPTPHSATPISCVPCRPKPKHGNPSAGRKRIQFSPARPQVLARSRPSFHRQTSTNAAD